MKHSLPTAALLFSLLATLGVQGCKRANEQPMDDAEPTVTPDTFAEGADSVEDASDFNETAQVIEPTEAEPESLGLIGGKLASTSAISNVTVGISYITAVDLKVNANTKFQIAKSQANCTGMVVAPTLILTAGHCFNCVKQASDLIVFTGNGNDSQTGGELGPSYAVARYGSRGNGTPASNDYGYIVLKKPISVKAIPLASDTELKSILKKSKQVYAIGFGFRDFAKTKIGKKGELSDTIFANDPANGLFSVGGAFYGTAAATLSSKHLCQGDSGGPLFAKTNTTKAWRIIGSVSYGDPNCKIGGTAYVALTKARVCWSVNQSKVKIPGYKC